MSRVRGPARLENPSKATLWRRHCVIKLSTSGLCFRCWKPRGVSGTEAYCRACADNLAKENAAMYRRRIEAGLCRQCEFPRGLTGTKVYCRPCADRVNENARARKMRSAS